MRLVDWLDRGARRAPERTCVQDDQGPLTYTEVVDATHAIAAALHEHGIKTGDRVAVYGPNSSYGLIGILSASRAGAVWVTANVRASVDELIDSLNTASCAALIYDVDVEEGAKRIEAGVPSIRWTVTMDELAGLPRGVRVEDPPEDPAAEAILGFTGGTTGKQKALMLTSRNMEAMITAFLADTDLGEPPVYLAAAPLTHSGGAACFPVLGRAGTVVIQRTPNPTEILDVIERQRITFTCLPPTLVALMIDTVRDHPRDMSSLRTFMYVGSPMSPTRVKEAIDVFGPVMVQVYGQSEAPMICTILTAADHVYAVTDGDTQILASAGRPSLVARVEIMDDDGNLLPAGEVGEVVVRGGLVMKGYLNADAANEEVRAHGWHHTGDVGYLGDGGYLYLVDRKKDMIISGGFNVFSAEVEQRVSAHPAVAECAVIGIPDKKWGEMVTAVVALRPGATLEDDDLIAWCKQTLGSVKAPKRVEIRPELPKSSVGKIMKKEIREEHWQGQERRIF